MTEETRCPKCDIWIDVDELYKNNTDGTFTTGIICPKCERWGKYEDWFPNEGE